MTQEYKDARKQVLWLRRTAREVIATYNEICQKRRSLERSRRKLEDSGVVFPLLDTQISTAAELQTTVRYVMVVLGSWIRDTLNDWQAAGATMTDLCYLCNAPFNKTMAVLKDRCKDGENVDFFHVVFTLNLDHKPHKHEWIGWEDDAPFAHCAHEFMVETLVIRPGAERYIGRALHMLTIRGWTVTI